MAGPFPILVFDVAVVAVPALVLMASLRRLARSRSLRAIAYALTALLAAAGLVAPTLLPSPIGGPVALISLPVWLLVRAAFPRVAPTYAEPVLRPVFASVRAAAARGELQRRPVAAT